MPNAAQALMRLFRRRAAAESVGRAVHARVRMQVEEMESRILHSADFAPAAFADLTGAQVEMRVLEAAPAASEPAATQESLARELVVVDTATENYQQLLDDLVAQNDERSFQILLIERDSDGVARLTDALSSLTDVAAVHIISHGSDGRIHLGSTVIDLSALRERAGEIAAWSNALAPDADLLIYGCDVAASADGRLLVDMLASLTGADVAASDDATGSVERGADWTLEYRAGSIETAVAISAATQGSWQGMLAVDVVLESYVVPFGDLDKSEVKSGQSWGQTFRYDSAAATYEVDKFSVVLWRESDASAGQTITISLRSTWNGAALASSTLSSNALGTSAAWITGTLAAPLTLNDNQTYYIRVDSSGDGKVHVGTDGSGSYARGALINKDGNAENGKDMAFRIIDSVGTAAPVLAGANNLSIITEDQASNGGTLVSSLIAGHVTDADPGALGGIAVTGVDNTNGTWQYSTNGGASWSAFGAASGASARLLAADANTFVRFVPNADWNGTVANGLTFRAWDQTSGAAGGTADTTQATFTVRDNFGAVSYNNNDGTQSWSAGWVDGDGNPGGGSIQISGGRLVLSTPVGSESIHRQADLTGATSASLVFDYDNQLGLLGTVRVQASGDGGANYTTIGTFGAAPGGTGTASYNFDSYIAANTRVRLVMDGTLLGGSFAVDNLRISYSVPLNGGTTAFSSATASSSVTVTAVNDAPVGTNGTVTTAEDTPFVFTTAAFGFTDPNDGPANNMLGVRIASLPAAGTLQLNGTAVRAGQIISVADIDAGGLVYNPAADASGAAHSSFTFQVQDDGGTANGGTDLDAVARTMTIDITAVNDAPVGSDRTVMLDEDTAFAFTTASFGFADPRDTPANSLLSVTIVSLPAAGTLTLNGAAVVAGQSIGVADIAAGKLVYTPPPNTNGAGYASFGFRMQDDGGTANGGVDLDPVVRNMRIDVASVNDRPVGTDNTVTANEDVAFAFSAAAFGLTDPDDSPANALLSVTIVSLPGAGVLALDGIAVSAGQSISAAALNAGRLTFTAAPDAHGAGYASFTFQVRDDGGTARGGLDTDATARTMTINVSAVNDAPVGTVGTRTTAEDTSLVFDAAAFGFSDPRDAPGNNLLAVRITSLPVAGSLTLAGTPLAAGAFVSLADIAAGRLVYTPDPNGNGAGYASFTFQVQDDGGVADGGADLDAVARALTINVTPVNDPPTGADRTVATQTNTAFTFNTAVFGFSDPLDAPANSFLAVQIISLPDAGALTLGNLEVVSGQFISTADVAAGKLRYLPARDTVGAASASFTFKVQDDGGGADLSLVARRITIDVTAPPVAAPVQVVENVIAPPTSETRESTTVTSAAPAQAAAQTPAQASTSATAQPAAEAEPPPAVGATADAAPVNTVAPPAPVQRLEVQQPNRESRNTAVAAPVIEAQVIALAAGERAADTGSFLTTSQTRTSTAFLETAAENREMVTEMDQMRDELRGEGKVEAGTIAATAATSLSLSVGYVIWLLRGGVLLSTLVSSVPAWRFVDPLPVLGRMDDENDMDEEGDDSLESLVARGDHAPAAPGDERETTPTERATT